MLTDSDEESPFIAEDTLSWDDGCDISLDVVRSVVTAGTVGNSRFTLDDGGAIVRSGTAEVLKDVNREGDDPAGDDIGDGPVPIKLGRGCRAKIRSRKYGAEWELQ